MHKHAVHIFWSQRKERPNVITTLLEVSVHKLLTLIMIRKMERPQILVYLKLMLKARLVIGHILQVLYPFVDDGTGGMDGSVPACYELSQGIVDVNVLGL